MKKEDLAGVYFMAIVGLIVFIALIFTLEIFIIKWVVSFIIPITLVQAATINVILIILGNWIKGIIRK
jgi:hypothetical protein